MDETTTLAVVGLALLVLVVGRLVLAMLGGGRGSGRTPVPRAVRLRAGERRGSARPRAAGTGSPGLTTVGRLGDDEVRGALDALKREPPRRRR